MKKRTAAIASFSFIGALLAALALAWGAARQEAVLAQVQQKAASMATEALGTEVAVGNIAVNSLHDITIHDIALYDKQAECIAKAESAEVHFSLLSVLQSPAGSVKEVVIRNADARLVQREDGSWNVNDIETGSGESDFAGTVRLEDSRLALRMNGKEVALDNVNGTLDCSDAPLMRLSAAADSMGAGLKVAGTVSGGRQDVHIEAEDIELANFLYLLPENALPEEVRINSGSISGAKADICRKDGMLGFMGQASFEKGNVRVMDTDIENIHGFTSFTDEKILLYADAESNGQSAHVDGSIRLDTGDPYLDLSASSDSFAPSAVLNDIPVEGAAAFRVHVTGTPAQPLVDGDVRTKAMTVCDIPVENASAHVRYAENTVYVTDAHANLLGGNASGEGELLAKDLSYTAHVKAAGLDASRFRDYVPEADGIAGLLSADLGIEGKGAELAALSVYGSASAKNGAFRDLPIDHLDTSFFLQGDDLTLDYLSAQLPNRSSLGMEGSVRDGRDLDLSFYGGHVDLSLISKLVPEADLTGLSDFKGTVRGDASNPQVAVDFSGLRGTLFKQPFDSLKTTLSGSLDGVNVDTFEMERGGKNVYHVWGSVGFTGERRINLRIDNEGVRMEDIAALVAPGQPITGNVDNTITVTGTLDDPHAVGYIHFTRGSYNGMLISGMDGDYYVNGNQFRLQDFHIYTPLVDMDLNGTLDTASTALDMQVAVHDIDMKRLQHKLPYDASGHGTFSGRIGGTLSAPSFDGDLKSKELVFNDVSMTDVEGHVGYHGSQLSLSNFRFRQGDGSYNVIASLDSATEQIAGQIAVQDAEINDLCALANLKNDLLQGTLTSSIGLGGTLQDPAVRINGSIPQGSFAGHDIHSISLDVNYNHHIAHINAISGFQGDAGTFTTSGTVDMSGPIDMKLSAKSLELGMFTNAAGIQTAVSGTADIEATVGDTIGNPSADVELTAVDGGVQSSTFDRLHGSFRLKDRLIRVQELVVQKTLAEHLYQASADGIVPLHALKPDASGESQGEQINLNLSLDQADLSLLPLLSDYVEWAVGPTQGSLKITGTLGRPLVNGNVAVPSGSLKIRGLSNPLENINISALFSGNQMLIDKCSATMGTGTLQLVGGTRFDGASIQEYDFSLTADALDVQSGFYRGPISGAFHLNEGETTYSHRKLPKLSGQLNIENCEVSIPSIPDTEGSLPEILMDLTVSLGKNVHFYSAHLYDMHLTGSAHFEGTTVHPKTSGTVSVLRGGTISYLKTVFNIREGEAYFNQVGSFLPSLNFFADTRLSRTRVFLSLQGPLNQMEFHLTSSPEMSQTEILQMLTLRDAYQRGDTNLAVGDMLALGLQMSLLSELEDVVRKTLVLDNFSISRGYGSAFERHASESNRNIDVYNVQIGKYINDRVMLKFTQVIGGNHVSRFGIQYDLNDCIGLTLEKEKGNFIVGVEARIKF